MDYDADRITYTNQNLVGPNQDNDMMDDGGMAPVEAKRQFREFIRSYRDGNLFPYRDQVQITREHRHWQHSLRHEGAALRRPVASLNWEGQSCLL